MGNYTELARKNRLGCCFSGYDDQLIGVLTDRIIGLIKKDIPVTNVPSLQGKIISIGNYKCIEAIKRKHSK